MKELEKKIAALIVENTTLKADLEISRTINDHYALILKWIDSGALTTPFCPTCQLPIGHQCQSQNPQS